MKKRVSHGRLPFSFPVPLPAVTAIGLSSLGVETVVVRATNLVEEVEDEGRGEENAEGERERVGTGSS